MVSIILPTYNRQNTISRSIKSVINQTYKDWELIIVDDASTDDTKNYVLRFTDPRIKYYKLDKNLGACYARNYGIKRAKGTYIAFQDSDDEWKCDKLAKQISFLEETHADMVFCRMLSDEEGKHKKIFPPKRIKDSCITLECVMEKNIASTQTFLVKSSCFEKVMFDEKMPRFQDWDFLLRFMQLFSVRMQEDVLVYQHLSKDSITKNAQKGELAILKLFEKFASLYREKDLEWALLYLLGTYKLQQKKHCSEIFYRVLKEKPSCKCYVKYAISRIWRL